MSHRYAAENIPTTKRAYTMLADEAQLRWGKNNVHLSTMDPMEPLSVLVVGPQVQQLIGRDTARSFAREALVFGVGLTNATASELKQQKPGNLAGRAAANTALGGALSVLSEIHPLGAAAVATGLSLSWAYNEFGAPSEHRNRQLIGTWQDIWNDSGSQRLNENTRRIETVIGPDAFNNIFDASAGAIGYKATQPLAKAVLPTLGEKAKNFYAAIANGLTNFEEAIAQTFKSPLAADGAAQEFAYHMHAARPTNATFVLQHAVDKLPEASKQIVRTSQANLKVLDKLGTLDELARNEFKSSIEAALAQLIEAVRLNDQTQIGKKITKLNLLNKATDCYKEGAEIRPLAPGVHQYSIDRLKNDFAYNAERKVIFERLHKVVQQLKEAGCQRLWVGGSFVTGKEIPGDFDICWDPAHVDLRRIDPLLNHFTQRERKEKYGGDIFKWVPEITGYDHVRGFQLDRHGESKGIIAIDLLKEH